MPDAPHKPPVRRLGDPTLPPPVDGHKRPRTRLDCLPGGCNEQRPCPWVTCKWHLWPVEAIRDGETTRLDWALGPNLNSLDSEDSADWDPRIKLSCALDIAAEPEPVIEAGRHDKRSDSGIAAALGITRQHEWTIERAAKERFRRAMRRYALLRQSPVLETQSVAKICYLGEDE